MNKKQFHTLLLFFLFGLVSFSIFKPNISHSDSDNSDNNTIETFIMDYVSIRYPNYQFSEFLYVGVDRQKLFHFRGNKIIDSYDISSSKYGAGSIAGSEQTPIGLHYIKSKHGHKVPLGGILQYKKYTGRIAQIETKPECTDRDEITTRIMTLAGLEDGINKGDPNDSFNRNIYIHGTAEEGLIGSPASHGCIRMRNADIVKLFDSIEVGIHVLILNN